MGKTQIIGDKEFIDNADKFSIFLIQNDPEMHKAIFEGAGFTFIQFINSSYNDGMGGKYGISPEFQKWGACGIGAMMVYGYFVTLASSRNFNSWIKLIVSSDDKHHLYPAYVNTCAWLERHEFPIEITSCFEELVRISEA